MNQSSETQSIQDYSDSPNEKQVEAADGVIETTANFPGVSL